MEVFMKIERIYIGGWFQRTMLQLTEIYDFLREGTSRLDLNKKKLLELHENLSLKEVNYELNGFEYLTFSTTLGINLKIFEDGLIVLSDDNTTEDKLFNDIDALASYYETKLSPALSYLFSLGAPVPKELANIKTVYPYFIVLKNATKTDINELLAKTDKQKYFEFSNDNFDVLRGDKYYFINTRNKNLDQVERFIEEQIFIREFKGQLHHYLNLHRTIWEKIAEVKENAKVRGKDIVEFSSKIDGYAKTINLVDARINQMNTYLRTREKIAKNDENLKEFLEVFEYKYETLGDTLAYMQQIWAMTKNYVNSAAALFNGLQQEITQKSLDNLTIVTSMGVGASLIGLFTATEMPVFTIFGVGYFLSLALVGYFVNRTMKYISENRKYHITDIEYDKNIK
jgi:hypothetical protein